MPRKLLQACGIVLGWTLCIGAVQAAVFTGVEYGRDGDRALLLDVRTPSKPGPFPVWVEWIERDASPMIVPDRENHAANTVLIRAVMPSRVAARPAAAAQLLTWLPASISGYGGDPERAAMIVRGAGSQVLLDLWSKRSGARSDSEEPPRSIRALVLVQPPASLRGHRNWPDLPLLLFDTPAHSGSLWRSAIGLRNQGIAAEPVIRDDLSSASTGLSTLIAAMLAASEVPRVQRFDQLAFATPLALNGRVLDSVRHESLLLALLWNARAQTVRLVSIEPAGAEVELSHWPWRNDARLASMGGRLLVSGSDTLGRPHAELGLATGQDWTSLSMVGVQSPVRLVAMAQRGHGDVALAWSRTGNRSVARAWLQRIHVAAAARVVTSRAYARAVRALAFVADAVVVALAPPDDGGASDLAGTATLAYWTTAESELIPFGDTDRAPWQALFALSPESVQVASQPALLGLRRGRVYAIDLACSPICVREELELDSVLSKTVESAPLSRVSVRGSRAESSADPNAEAPWAQWLQHPETGEALLALMPSRMASAGALDDGAAWFIRQSSGRYGFARLPASRDTDSEVSLRAVQPWPTAAYPNRFALFANAGDQSLLFPAQLQRSMITPGLWWDPARSGHGFDLRRAGDGWQVTIYTFDKSGSPIWLRGDGEIHAGRWHAHSDGLLRYRIERGSVRVEIDRRTAQSLELDFVTDGVQDECTAAALAGGMAAGRATLALGQERSVFCLQPLRLAAGGRPQIDLDGIWSARDDLTPWQLALTTQGEDPRARISAMLTYFDHAGAPRWAYAASDWRDGVVDLPLLAVGGACTKCSEQPFTSSPIGALSLRATGECGAIRLAAALRIGGRNGAVGMPTGYADLVPTALLGCY